MPTVILALEHQPQNNHCVKLTTHKNTFDSILLFYIAVIQTVKLIT